MADDRIVGYPSEVTVTGDVVSFSAGQWSKWWFPLITSSHYCFEIGGSAKSILSVGGEQADGTFEITMDTGHGFATGDRVSPTRSATAYEYTTIALARAAATNGDSFLIWWPSSKGELGSNKYYGQGAGSALLVSYEGMVGSVRLEISGSYALLINDATPSLGTDNVYIRNLAFDSYQTTVLRVSSQTGTYGNIIIDGCFCRVCRPNGLCIYVGTDDMIVQNNITTGGLTGIYAPSASGDIIIQNNTCSDSQEGIQLDGGADQTCRSNIATFNTLNDFVLGASVVRADNLSTDGTGSSTQKTRAERAFWGDSDVRERDNDRRIGTDSDAYQASTDLDVELDCDGNTRNTTTPSIGAHMGDVPYYVEASGGGGGGPIVGNRIVRG